MRQKTVLVVLVILLLSSCSSEKSNDNYIEDMHGMILDTYGEEYLPSISMSRYEIEEQFGINTDQVVDYLAEKPIMSTHIDVFICLEMQDGETEVAVDSFENYLETLKKDGSLSRLNQKKLESAQILVDGQYVSLMILGTSSEN